MSETPKIPDSVDKTPLDGVFRSAVLKDAKAIQRLILIYAERNLMLPRSLNEIYETIRQYNVYDKAGEIVGVCGLHIAWEDLAEIRALAVSPENEGKGIGARLVRMALDESKQLGVPNVFTLTYASGFFETIGFTVVDKQKLPHKIWVDCIRCHKFPDCDETALMIAVSNAV